MSLFLGWFKEKRKDPNPVFRVQVKVAHVLLQPSQELDAIEERAKLNRTAEENAQPKIIPGRPFLCPFIMITIVWPIILTINWCWALKSSWIPAIP